MMSLERIAARLRAFDTAPVKRVIEKHRDQRPYSTRNGFYVGDRVEVAPAGYVGHISTVYGPNNDRCRVEFADGGGMYVSDERLTRLGDD